MRWALLLVTLAGVCAIVNLIRGVIVYDGISLLAVAFLAAAVLVAFLGHAAEQSERRRRARR